MTHTPGPWKVVEHSHADGRLWLSVNQAEQTAGGYEWVAEIKYLMTEPERQKANARLIAAAPALYAAVQDVLDWWHADSRHFTALEPKWLALLRAALSQAEGKGVMGIRSNSTTVKCPSCGIAAHHVRGYAWECPECEIVFRGPFQEEPQAEEK